MNIATAGHNSKTAWFHEAWNTWLWFWGFCYCGKKMTNIGRTRTAVHRRVELFLLLNIVTPWLAGFVKAGDSTESCRLVSQLHQVYCSTRH